MGALGLIVCLIARRHVQHRPDQHPSLFIHGNVHQHQEAARTGAARLPLGHQLIPTGRQRRVRRRRVASLLGAWSARALMLPYMEQQAVDDAPAAPGW
jgi:hypothetical protein